EARHRRSTMVKRGLVLTVLLGASVLAGCQHQMTLEEARAACTKQGGFLVVIHTMEVTMAGVGPETDSPGDCISPGKFGTAAAKPAPAN
ncbi:MAG TPA: C-type lectin domain-containing protein, partial [Rhizomicrobium sp.]